MHQSTTQSEHTLVVPPEIAPSEDLTARARQVPDSVELVLCGEPQYAALFDRIARVLHRRDQGNVLLVAERGVGVGAMLAELARWAAGAGTGDWGLGAGDSEAAAGQIPNHKEQITNKGADNDQIANPNDQWAEGLSAVSSQLSAGGGEGGVDSRLRRNNSSAARWVPPFLSSKRFIEVTCRYTVSEESRGRLLALLASVAGQEKLVVCIDAFASLLRGERGGTNKGALLSALTSWHIGQVQSAECRVKSEAAGVFGSGATDNGPRTTDEQRGQGIDASGEGDRHTLLRGLRKVSQSPTRIPEASPN